MIEGVSPVFLANQRSKAANVINEGGAGSTKTYSILQLLIFQYGVKKQVGTRRDPFVVTTVRKSYAEMQTTCIFDFFRILSRMGLYKEKNHKQSHPQEYRLNNTLYQFYGLDKASKVRGARRDILFANEANFLLKDDFMQLRMRTRGQCYLDYNPSFTEHEWLDDLIAQEDSQLIHSNHLDGWDFISEGEKREILRLQSDPYYWQVYGLGQRGEIRGKIFENWQLCDTFPDDCRIVGYGLDFGFTNNVTALVKVGRKGDDVYLQQLIYETGLVNIKHTDSIDSRMRAAGVPTTADIIADSAEPKSIQELKNEGWNVLAAKKGKDSILNGIDTLKRYNLYITKDSVELTKEARNYKWKEINGKMTNTPVDSFNHCWDAIRYVASRRLKVTPYVYG